MTTMIIAQQSTGGLIISSSSTGTQGPPGPAVTPGAAGQFYVTNAAATAPEWKALSGDVTDSAVTTGQVTVTGLQGAITLSGAAANGNVLTATSSSAAHWAAPAAGGITQLTGEVTAGPGSGSQAATITPGTAGQIAVSNASPAFAWTSLVTYDTSHGTLEVGNGGSDTVAWVGPYPSAETTDAGLFLLTHGATRNNSNFVVAFGTAIVDALGTHAGSAAFNAPGKAGTYGDVFVTNANGNAGTLEILSRWDGTSGTLFASYGVQSASSATAGVSLTNGTTPIVQSGTSATSLTVGTNKSGASLALQAGAASTALTLSNPSGTITATTTSGQHIAQFRAKGTNYTIDSIGAGDEQIWMTAACTITLPAPTTYAGRVLEIIVNYDPAVGGGTIARNGSENINGAASNITLATGDKYSVLQIRCNGTDWVIKGGLSI